MPTLLILAYITGSIYFCSSSLLSSEPDKKLTWLDLFLAIVLPLACVVGAILHLLSAELPFALWCVYCGVWIFGFAGALWELRDMDQFPDNRILNFVIGLPLLGAMFGPGLYLGASWLRTTFIG